MINNNELSRKLDLIIENQREIKAMQLITLKALDFLVQHEKGPDEFIQNILADVLVDSAQISNKFNTINK